MPTTRDLDELVHIWERWTDNDSVFRRAFAASEHCAETFQELLFEADGHLIVLTRHATPGDSGTYAAVLAGGALLLALRGVSRKDATFWRRVARDARHAHQKALAAAQPDTVEEGKLACTIEPAPPFEDGLPE